MPSPRFLTLTDVAELLNVSPAQAYALVRGGDLPAVKIGGRGQWRVEDRQLEGYIARLYDETATFIAEHPFGRPDDLDGDPGPAHESHAASARTHSRAE